MADVATNKQRSQLGSTSSQSQQSKVVSSVIGEPLESKLTLKDLEELMSAFMVNKKIGLSFLCGFQCLSKFLIAVNMPK